MTVTTEKLCNPQDCTLCMACMNICPTKAIELSVTDTCYETLTINTDKCTDCGMCGVVCSRRAQVESFHPIECFAAQAINKEQLMDSASGGAFQILAQQVLKSGGVCYGAEGLLENSEYITRHVRIDSLSELKRILNSKYVPSFNQDTYRQAKSDLKDGRLVLYCGTPCQIQGLRAYLNREYDNLLTADLICHGVTSGRMFNDWLGELQKRESITIVDYQFRDKSISWGTNFRFSYYKNKDKNKKVRVKHCPREASSYMINYLKGNIFRENCYSCSLSSSQRVSDFTLGDYWEIETEHPEFITKRKPPIVLRQGVSCILVNTTKAQGFVSGLSSEMVMHSVSFESVSAHNSNLRHSSKRGSRRDKLLDMYINKGYSAVEDQYRRRVGKKAYIYNLKNMMKSHLPDRVRIFIYRTPFLRKIVFH